MIFFTFSPFQISGPGPQTEVTIETELEPTYIYNG